MWGGWIYFIFDTKIKISYYVFFILAESKYSEKESGMQYIREQSTSS